LVIPVQNMSLAQFSEKKTLKRSLSSSFLQGKKPLGAGMGLNSSSEEDEDEDEDDEEEEDDDDNDNDNDDNKKQQVNNDNIYRNSNDDEECIGNHLTTSSTNKSNKNNKMERRNRRKEKKKNKDDSKHKEDIVNEWIFDHITTLAETFLVVPAGLGFNIEIKYPYEEECIMFSLSPIDKNTYLDRILEVVFEHAGDRPIIFSCFEPDVCKMLSLKQPA